LTVARAGDSVPLERTATLCAGLPRTPIRAYRFIRPLVFAIDPERAHRLALAALGAIGARPRLLARASGAGAAPAADVPARTVAGIRFSNPVGVAAGYDKDAVAVAGLAALGFGFVEVGTVTPHPQPGNARPRVARIPREAALANALGFPSAGAAAVAARLRALRGDAGWARIAVPIGASIGMMRDTEPNRAAADYADALRQLAPFADFVIVNVSSPNTAGLARLRAADRLDALLSEVAAAARAEGAARGTAPRPLFAKLAPDLEPGLLEEIVDAAAARGLAGLVLTNTLPAERPGLLASPRFGLSGAPLRARALAALERARARAGGRLALIGVGGIMTPQDAIERLAAGADLIQLYTGLVYEGPGLLGRTLAAIARAARGAALASSGAPHADPLHLRRP
jgi:dihydroorotate dehydrogenase